jgi:glutaredoxin
MDKAILAALLALILAYGCLGQGQVSNEDVEKILNGEDRKNVSVSILMYYGDGCPHCENTLSLLNALNQSYNISLEKKEVWYNKANSNEMYALYSSFGANNDTAGVPTMLVDRKMMVIGELSVKNWIKAIDRCGNGKCPSGVFDDDAVSALS